MATPATKEQLETLTSHVGAWDWEDQHISQSFKSPNGTLDSFSINDIIESGTVLIAAGPADLDKAIARSDSTVTGFRLVPIGLVETAQISMNKPLSRIFEIGSKLSYLIPGRTVGGISLSRVFFDGPSLLKAIYMGEVMKDEATKNKKRVMFESDKYYGDTPTEEQYQEFAPIGSGNLAMNLASSFFDQPVGLSFFFQDQQKQTVGQTYFEGCRVSSYSMGISANMNVLTESINMEFVRCRPINTKSSSEGYTKGDLIDLNIVSTNPVVAATE